jgi:hypothetical protein
MHAEMCVRMYFLNTKTCVCGCILYKMYFSKQKKNQTKKMNQKVKKLQIGNSFDIFRNTNLSLILF